MARRDSGPISKPIRPYFERTFLNTDSSRSSPSFSGLGEGQVRICDMSLTQEVARQLVTPVSGITAVGWPTRGRTKYQGRDGLAQGNWDMKPERYSRFGSLVTITASSLYLVISLRARSARPSISAWVKGRSSGRRASSFTGEPPPLTGFDFFTAVFTMTRASP